MSVAATNCYTAATEYALRGWPVFPVDRQKKPCTPHGFKDATTDPAKIAEWWTQYPAAGVAAAVPPRHFVLDVDPRNGGEQALAELVKAHGPLPATAAYRTGGGGKHLWFQLHKTFNGDTLRAAIALGLDLKAAGKGYVVLPPSPHESGRFYAWESYCDLDSQKIAEAPPWLVALITAGAVDRKDGAAGVDPAKILAGVSEGERDATLFRFACSLRRDWIPRAYAEVLILAAARACRPPFPDDEALKKLEQAWKFPAGDRSAQKIESAHLETAREPAEDRSASLSCSLLELERNPPPPVRWILEPLLPEKELALLFGKPFGGKSLFALQLGLHAAAGLTFLPGPDPGTGFRFPRPLRVLYFDEEMGLPLLCRRIDLMKAGRPEFRDPEVLRRFRVVSRAGLKLDNEKGRDLIRREIDQFADGSPDLAFMDTLRRMHNAEEKDSGEMAQVMAEAIALIPAKIPIHHSKKGPQDEIGDWRDAARGSGDIVAASQTVLAVWKSEDLLFSMRADVKAAGEIQPIPLLLDAQTLLYRRQTEDERFASKGTQHEAAVSHGMAELCKALRKLKERGDKLYPPSWNAWHGCATGNRETLTEARSRLQSEGTVRKVKRTGQGGGDAYLFAEDYDNALGAGSGTVPNEDEE